MTALTSAVTGDGEITLSAHLDGTRDQAWSLLTEPANLPMWLGSPVIWDLEIGGRLEVEIDAGHRFAGEFIMIDPPARLVFTWGWRTGSIPIAPGSTTVEMRLTPADAGCDLELVHTNLGEWAERNIVGWSIKLERLMGVSDGTNG